MNSLVMYCIRDILLRVSFVDCKENVDLSCKME